jgi:hypothetical protein
MATDNQRLGSGVRPEATNDRHLPRFVKVALRTKARVAKSPHKLLK